MKYDSKECPCKHTECERFAKCEECIAHHRECKGRKNLTSCEKAAKREEKAKKK